MKNVILAAFAVMSLGMGTAFAIGNNASDPQYGTFAFPTQQYHTGTVFSEIYHGIFGHRTNDTPAVASNVDSRAPVNTVR